MRFCFVTFFDVLCFTTSVRLTLMTRCSSSSLVLRADFLAVRWPWIDVTGIGYLQDHERNNTTVDSVPLALWLGCVKLNQPLKWSKMESPGNNLLNIWLKSESYSSHILLMFISGYFSWSVSKILSNRLQLAYKLRSDAVIRLCFDFVSSIRDVECIRFVSGQVAVLCWLLRRESVLFSVHYRQRERRFYFWRDVLFL